MTEQSTFARRVRAAKPRATKHEVRDDVVSGLALAIQPTGVRTWFVSRMVRGRRRYATIGSADAMTIPEARREARRLIASYIEPAKTDNGPRTPGHPMDAFAGEFLERYARHWKPRTLTANAYLVRNHILPAFGHMTVDAIAVEHVRDWFASMPGLRLHDLRHSWASTAAMNGVDMVTIAKLLGHALVETTERYVHLSDRSVADAADRVSNRIHAALAGREEGDGKASRAVRPAQDGPETQPRGAIGYVHI